MFRPPCFKGEAVKGVEDEKGWACARRHVREGSLMDAEGRDRHFQHRDEDMA